MTSATDRTLLRVVLLAGVLARVAFVWDPVGPASLASWREADYTQIARSFDRDSLNPLYPRVHWRGDTTGEVESEFPFVPWIAALSFALVGNHEQLLRIVSAAFGVAALLGFAALASRALPDRSALLATALFASNGLAVALSGSIQPESACSAFSIWAVFFLWKWVDGDDRRSLMVASSLLALAILAKSPAALLGLLFAYAIIERSGYRGLWKPETLIAAAIAVVPAMGWYWWAHQHFLATGLSLGLSNETHLINLELLREPLRPLLIAAFFEVRDSFSYFGVILLAASAMNWRSRGWRRAAIWYASVLLFYLAALDTAGDVWSWYYHLLGVPSACLLMGFGLESLDRTDLSARWRYNLRPLAAGLALIVIVSSGFRSSVLLDRRRAGGNVDLYSCSLEFAELVPANELIVVRGGVGFDPHGHPVAYNASMAFTWMDRFGFNYASEEATLDTLLRLRDHGATFWLVQPQEIDDASVREAMSVSSLAGTCRGHSLYNISGAESGG